jgi:hypothetical protein
LLLAVGAIRNTHERSPNPVATMVASIQLTRSRPAVRVRMIPMRLKPINGQPARYRTSASDGNGADWCRTRSYSA